MKKRTVVLLGLLCLIGLAGAMVSTNYVLNWHVSGGGGGPLGSTNYQMDSTVGQIIRGSESTNYRLDAGYWSGILVIPSEPSAIFNTGFGTYPSIAGRHNGTIRPNETITVHKLYTHPCPGTGGHTEYVKIWKGVTPIAEKNWSGYLGDWHTITFDESFILYANETYNYTICTGSYPQIIHASSYNAIGGVITCEEFVDSNGKRHEGWIPAIRLE
jgi:hypothetical protein